MKITVLLCALATIAAAVPTNLHEIRQEQESVPEKLPTTIQREKKSPLHDHHGIESTSEAGTDAIPTQATSKSGRSSHMEGRSLGFKKPIIVKKKIGYHVYRDSDEEMAHADPHENCSKQVKVKLCDEETGSPINMVNCLTAVGLKEEISDKEIENSLITAKEAVANLQRGFHRMEHNSAKLATTEDKELEDDLAVHEHIEAARQALEHVQHNFGNLDTLNLQATAPKTEDFQSKSSDEERLAQWKEAIDNIQKNFEIARNIEDAFKTDSDQMNLQSTHINDSAKIKESEHTVELQPEGSDAFKKQSENSDADMFTAPTEHKELKVKLHSDSLRSEKLTEDQETKSMNIKKSNEHSPTMKNSEFTPLTDDSLKTDGVKFSDHVHQQQPKAVNDMNLENEKLESLESNTHNTKLKMEKNALSETEDITLLLKDKSVEDKLDSAKSALLKSLDQTSKHHEHDMTMESSDVNTHQRHMEVKNSVSNDKKQSMHKGELIEAKNSFTDGQSFDQSPKTKSMHDFDEHFKHIERMSHEIPEPTKEKETNMPQQMHINALNTNLAKDKQRNLATITNMRSADEKHIEFLPTEQQNTNAHSFMRMVEGQNMEHKLNVMHDLHNDHSGMRMPLSEDLTTPTKIAEFNNRQQFPNGHTHTTGHHLSENHEQVPMSTLIAQEQHETMRMNEQQNIQNQVTDNHNLRENFLMRLAQEKQQNGHLKSSPEFHNGHLHEAFRFPHNLANTHDLSQLGPRMQEHLHIMKHAMTSDMDNAMQPNMHMRMREAIGNPAFERNDNMHWNHHHHATARYGAGLPLTGASSGAVGLFPNAETGNCGIPLMLSCSPSVVSGTLAKASVHPGPATAPAYRSGDDVMFYMKRDAKDTDELPTIKVQKSSLPFTHKTELIFDKTQ